MGCQGEKDTEEVTGSTVKVPDVTSHAQPGLRREADRSEGPGVGEGPRAWHPALWRLRVSQDGTLPLPPPLLGTLAAEQWARTERGAAGRVPPPLCAPRSLCGGRCHPGRCPCFPSPEPVPRGPLQVWGCSVGALKLCCLGSPPREGAPWHGPLGLLGAVSMSQTPGRSRLHLGTASAPIPASTQRGTTLVGPGEWALRANCKQCVYVSHSWG